jgi:hypothetical protein
LHDANCPRHLDGCHLLGFRPLAAASHCSPLVSCLPFLVASPLFAGQPRAWDFAATFASTTTRGIHNPLQHSRVNSRRFPYCTQYRLFYWAASVFLCATRSAHDLPVRRPLLPPPIIFTTSRSGEYSQSQVKPSQPSTYAAETDTEPSILTHLHPVASALLFSFDIVQRSIPSLNDTRPRTRLYAHVYTHTHTHTVISTTRLVDSPPQQNNGASHPDDGY